MPLHQSRHECHEGRSRATFPERGSSLRIAWEEPIEADNATGDIFIITDNLSSHNSAQTRAWLAEHPDSIRSSFPTFACWLNLQGGWWRLFRRDALAGQSFANSDEIEQATRIAVKHGCQVGRTPA